MTTVGKLARIALGLIRLANGAIGLVAPQVITRRFTEEAPPVAAYALRMFGIRTVLVAFDLLRRDGPDRRHAIRVAPAIHASDLLGAILVARMPGVPRQTGMMIVGISALNTLLALLMQRAK